MRSASMIFAVCVSLAHGACKTENDIVIGYQQDIHHFASPSVDDCCEKCNGTANCVAYTLSGGDCWLHDGASQTKKEKGAISGMRDGPLPPTPAPPGPTPPPTLPPTTPGETPSELAAATCAKLSFVEKADMMHGFGKINGYSRNSGCAYECGRKTFRWDNGPQGFGDGTIPGSTTEWPSCLNIGATFDPALALEWGSAMGYEFWAKGTNIQEGPGINVARIMRNGRNFEYISGEDPVMGSVMVQPLIKGIQKNVMAVAKHYILNNQETDRSGVNEIIDEKTLMELYGPPFAAAAKAGVAAYMCAYNRINGDWACENKLTLKTMLKGYYNFSGFVVSDWGATHSVNNTLQNGLDIEMPNANHFNSDNIKKAIEQGVITEAEFNDRCERILRSYFSVPVSQRSPCGGAICIDRNVSTAEHKALARKLSSMSTILLKNEGQLLPLDPKKKLTYALIGPDAESPYTGGSGSGGVSNKDRVSAVSAFAQMGLDAVYVDGWDAKKAAAAAKAADIAIVFGSAHTGEGSDRKNLNLEGNIDALIPDVAAAQPKTIVVLSVPGSILTDWRDSVPAILTNLMPGEQVGPALVDVLFGAVPPQAKLPVTFPNKENEQDMTAEQYPGIKTPEYSYQATYSEGQIVGYRWYDKHNVKPAFAFGHGLTYGNFTYSSLSVSGRTVSFTVQRSSGTGCDTPQIYLSFPAATTDPKVPLKVLRYFQKTCEDETKVSYTFTDADVSNWDVAAKKWTVTTGKFGVSVGSSSQDVRLTGSLAV